MFPITVPPRVKAGVVVPVYGLPEALVRKKEEVEAEVSPVPPFPTASGVPDQLALLTVLKVAREPRPETSEVAMAALIQFVPLYFKN